MQPTVIIASHEVKDYQTWRKAYEADHDHRVNAGIKQLAIGRRADDPNRVYMVWEVMDISHMENMLGDPEFVRKMAESGVVGTPELIFLNEDFSA
jgi:hypothetical protein